MSDKKLTVDQAIDEVAAEGGGAGLESVQEALDKAQESMDSVREVLAEAEGQPREKSYRAAEKARLLLEDTKRHLGQAREAISRLAARTREKAEALYARVKEQYEALAARTRELYQSLKERIAQLDLKGKSEDVLEYIRCNPGKSILIALAVGFVIGYATRPRE
jgi:ElaB/YqjD/DUF883 family membrane-anchored ribosome-binding protein